MLHFFYYLKSNKLKISLFKPVFSFNQLLQTNMHTLTNLAGRRYGMYLNRLSLFFAMLLAGSTFAQSPRTVTFSGNPSDFSSNERFGAANNVDYYVTYDNSFVYFGAFRTGGNTWGAFDHFTIYVDSDPQTSPGGAGNGSTGGVNWDGASPTLPFRADYRIAIRRNSLGESFYSNWNGSSWNTGGTNGQGWTQFATSSANGALEVRIPRSDLGNPEAIYFTMYCSFNPGGFFAVAPGGSGPSSFQYFGGIGLRSNGCIPLNTQNSTIQGTLTNANPASGVRYGTIRINDGSTRTAAGPFTIASGGLVDISSGTLACGANAVNLGTAGTNPTISGGATINKATAGNITTSGASNFTFTGPATITLTGGSATLQSLTLQAAGNPNDVTNGVRQGSVVNGPGTLTVAGTLSVSNGGLNPGSGITNVNGNLQLNFDGFVAGNTPVYGSSSTLNYNSGANYIAGDEWQATTFGTAGSGRPQNVTISTAGTNLLLPTTDRAMAGNISINASTTLSMNTTSGVLYVGGNFSNSGTFNANGRMVSFEGGTAASISGSNTFSYLRNNKTANLTFPTGTTIINAPGGGDGLQLNNTGAIIGSGVSSVISLQGGSWNIALGGTGTRTIGNATGVLFEIAGTAGNTKTVTSSAGASLTFATGTSTVLQLNNAGLNPGTSLTTIQGELRILEGGFISTNPPVYSATGQISYRTGGLYNVGSEWTATTTGSAGLGRPQNVILSNTTPSTLNLPNVVNEDRAIAGNLDIQPGATLNLSTVLGNDLFINGNFTRNGTFNPNSRAVFFTGSGTQTISGTPSPIIFDYLVLQKSGASSVQLSAVDISVNGNSGDVLQFIGSNAATLDLNGRNLNLNNDGGDILINSTSHLIQNASTVSTSVINITGNKGIRNSDLSQRNLLLGSYSSVGTRTIEIRVTADKTLTIKNLVNMRASSGTGTSALQFTNIGAGTTNGSVHVASGGVLSFGGGGTGTIQSGGRVTVSGELAHESGTFSNSSATFIVNSGGQYRMNRDGGAVATGTWDIASTLLLQPTTNNSTSATGGNGLAQTGPFGNVIIDHAQTGWNMTSFTSSNTMNIAGNLTVRNTGTTNFHTSSGAGVFNILVGGNYLQNTTGSPVVRLVNSGSATTNLTITGSAFVSLGTLDLCGAGTGNFSCAALNLSGGILQRTAGGSSAINGIFTQSGGTFTPGAFGYSFGDNVSFSAGIFNSGSAAWNPSISGDFSVSASMTTFNPGAGTYTFSGTNKQLLGDRSYTLSNATFSGSYTNNTTNSSGIIFTNALGGSGSFTQGTGGLANIPMVTFNGTTTPLGTVTLSAGNTNNLVVYGGAAQNVAAVTYHNLRLQGGSFTKSLTGNTIVNGDLNLNSATTILAAGASNLSVGGNISADAAGTLTFSSGIITVSGNISGAGALAITPSGAGTLRIGGNWTNTGLFTPGTSTVEYFRISGNQTIKSANYNSLTISGGGTKTLASSISTGGSAYEGILNLVAGTLVLNGNFLTINGTIVNGTGTITGSATSSVIIGPSVSQQSSPAGTLIFTSGASVLNSISFNRNMTGGSSSVTAEVVRLGTSLQVQSYTFAANAGYVALADGKTFTIAGTSGLSTDLNNSNCGPQRYFALGHQSRLRFAPNASVAAATSLVFQVGIDPNSSMDVRLNNATGSLAAAALSATNISGTGTAFQNELAIGQQLIRSDGTVLGTVSAIASQTSLTLAAPGLTVALSGGETFLLRRMYRPVTLVPAFSSSFPIVGIRFRNHAGGSVVDTINMPKSGGINKRSDYLWKIEASTGFSTASVSHEVLIPNDFNETVSAASIAGFVGTRTGASGYFSKLSPSNKIIGSLGNYRLTRGVVNNLDDVNSNYFITGETNGFDLPDDPTFTWLGGGLPDPNSWTQANNWQKDFASDPYPNNPIHLVRILGGTGNPTIPGGSTIAVGNIIQNARKLVVSPNAYLRIAGNYNLNFPQSSLQAGTGLLNSTGINTLTGTGTSFLTELQPGSYIYRSGDNLLIGLVTGITSNSILQIQANGFSGETPEAFSGMGFNFVTPVAVPGTGQISLTNGQRLVSISGGTFSAGMVGRVLLDGSGNYLGLITNFLNSGSVELLSTGSNGTYSGSTLSSASFQIRNFVTASGSGTNEFQPTSIVEYNGNNAQNIGQGNYENLVILDSRSTTGQPGTISFKHIPVGGVTVGVNNQLDVRLFNRAGVLMANKWQFGNTATLNYICPDYTNTAFSFFNSYDKSTNANSQIGWGYSSSARLNFYLTINSPSNSGYTLEGQEAYLMGSGRMSNWSYTKGINGGASQIATLPNGANVIAHGTATFTNLANPSGILILAGNSLSPFNSFTLNGPINGFQLVGPGGSNLNNITVGGSGTITGDMFTNYYSNTSLVTKLNTLTLNRPGITITLTPTASQHLICAGNFTVTGGSLVAPPTNDGNLGGIGLIVSGTGSITTNNSNFVGAGSGNVTVSGNGSVTVNGNGYFGTSPTSFGDVLISENGVVNLSAGTNPVGHGTSRDWIQSGGTVTLPNSATCPFGVVRNFIMTGGTISKAAGNFNLGQSAFAAGNFTFNGGTANFNGADLVIGGGSGDQSYISSTNKAITFRDVRVNKTSGNFSCQSGNLRVLRTFTIVSNTQVTASTGKITFVSDASQTGGLAAVPAGATVTGTNWTMERFFTGNDSRWSFLGTPITGASVSQMADDFRVTSPVSEANVVTDNPERSTIFTSEETQGGIFLDNAQKRTWRMLGSNNITVGKGYRTFIKGDGLLSNRIWDVTGGMTVGPQTINLTKTAYTCSGSSDQCSVGDQGWNLIANPLPSGIDWNHASLGKTNINNAFYRWETNAYRAYIQGAETFVTGLPASTGVPSNVWPSSQGAFVYVLGAAPNSGSVTFTEASKVSSSGSFFRTNAVKVNQLGIGIFGEGLTDQTGIWFKPEASGGFDLNMDAHKLMNPALSLYTSTTDGIGMAYNSLPMFDETTIVPLYVKSELAGNFTLTFGDVNTFDEGITVYLKDNYLGEIIPIGEGMQYPFSIDGNAASQTERFEIVFAPSAVTAVSTGRDAFAASVVPNPGNGQNLNILLKNPVASSTRIIITDMLGKVILDEQYSGQGNSIRLQTDLPNGVYQAAIINGKEKALQKIVVNR